MKIIYVYTKLGLNAFLVNLHVVKDLIFMYIYFFWEGGGCRGIKKPNPLVTVCVNSLCIL